MQGFLRGVFNVQVQYDRIYRFSTLESKAPAKENPGFTPTAWDGVWVNMRSSTVRRLHCFSAVTIQVSKITITY